jgi:hypothetical protein
MGKPNNNTNQNPKNQDKGKNEARAIKAKKKAETKKYKDGGNTHNRNHKAGRRSPNENRLGTPSLQLGEGRPPRSNDRSRKVDKGKRKKVSPWDRSALELTETAMKTELEDVLRCCPKGENDQPDQRKLTDEQKATISLCHQIRELVSKAITAVETRNPKDAILFIAGVHDGITEIPGVINLLGKFEVNFHLTGVVMTLERFVSVQKWALANPLPKPGPKTVMQRGLRAIAQKIAETHPDVSKLIVQAADSAKESDHWKAARIAAVASQKLTEAKIVPETAEDEEGVAALEKWSGVLARFTAIQGNECEAKQRDLMFKSARALNLWVLIRAFQKAQREQAAAAKQATAG